MTANVTTVLEQRAHRVTRAQHRRAWIVSALAHLALTAGVWAANFFEPTPPPRPIAPVVRLVSPAALGIPQPAPPTRKKAEPKPTPPPPPPPKVETPKVEPPPTAPPPAPKPDVPVIASKKAKPAPPQPAPPQPAASSAPPEVAKRRGILRGNPLGSSSSASIGVEDPDFTYGYYLDAMVGHIGQYWTRPNVAQRLEEAQIYYRIQPDGRVTDLRLVQSSGSTLFDDAAMRAVQAAVPLPPLPRGYKKDYLGITLVVQ